MQANIAGKILCSFRFTRIRIRKMSSLFSENRRLLRKLLWMIPLVRLVFNAGFWVCVCSYGDFFTKNLPRLLVSSFLQIYTYAMRKLISCLCASIMLMGQRDWGEGSFMEERCSPAPAPKNPR